MEDPRETLDYSYQRQLEMLHEGAPRAWPTWPPRASALELQMNQLQQQQTKLDGQAQQALAAGREDLAREALTRKSGLQHADRRPGDAVRTRCRPRRRS